MNTDIKTIKRYIENKNADSITSIVIIDGTSYTFSPQKIPGMPITMMLPDGITLMGMCSKKIKYPDENRPDVILTVSSDETVNFLFTKTDETITQQDLPEIIQRIQTVIKRMNPHAICYHTGEIVTKLSDVYWFDYSTTALDDDIYNIMFILCLSGTLVIGGFCCLQDSRKKWSSLVLQMVESISQEEGSEDELKTSGTT